MKNTLASIVVGLALSAAPALASAQGFEVTIAPPALRTEVQPPQPGPGFVWTPGYWNWNGAQHVWVNGQWAMPQQPGATYVPPRWERGRRGYRFEPGRWNAPRGSVVGVVQPGQPVQPTVIPPVAPQGVVVVNPGAPVYATQAPPRPRFERRPRLMPGQVWVAGSWSWNGSQYVWNAGHVEAVPQGRRGWQQPQWQRQGGRWQYRPGQWR